MIDHDGESASGERAIYFLPEGPTENLSVRLAEQDGARATVVLSAALGSAQREETEEQRR